MAIDLIDHDKRAGCMSSRRVSKGGWCISRGVAAFLPNLEAELLAFPQSKTDDQVDSISQALAYEFSGYTLDNL